VANTGNCFIKSNLTTDDSAAAYSALLEDGFGGITALNQRPWISFVEPSWKTETTTR
jgi:hypothetical protein